MASISLEDLPLDAQRRIKAKMAQEENEKRKLQSDSKVLNPTPHASRPLHVTGNMNKTEARYALEILDTQKKQGKLHSYRFEAMKFRLADNSYYTPDFLVMRWDGSLEIHEVKGHMEDDAAVKLRQVHEIFPFRVFIASHLAGQWCLKEVGENW